MENLQTVMEAKKLEDLQVAAKSPATTTLEPTAEEIETILVALKEGKDHRAIKKTVRRVIEKDGKQVSAQGFSFEQIKEIDDARKAKIAELMPKEETVTPMVVEK